MKLLHTIQEKLADRFSFVQYPNIRPADSTTRETSRSGWRFKTAMPLGKRIDLFLMSMLLLIAGSAALFFVGLFIYCLI